MNWPKESKELIEPLSKLFPFDSPQWKEWMSSRKEQNLEGKWIIAGYQPGMGYYQGSYTFTKHPNESEDEYLIEKEAHYQNGTTLKMQGEGVLYGEYHLRFALAPTPLTGRIEGVFDLDAANMSFSGKWWTLVQDTNAYGNEQFSKVGESGKMIAAFPQGLQIASGKDQELTLIGADLPKELSESDFEFSDANLKVKEIQSVDGSKVVCKIEVGEAASKGPAKLKLKNISGEATLVLYNSIDGIKILPSLGRARVSSGAAYPPHGVQFVARAVDFGQDGKPDTEDDLILDPIDAQWWLEEEKTRENDDDLKYLMAPIGNGLYTPLTTYAPIEERVQRREGAGLIAVGASYKVGEKELKSRALLAVTEPDFITHIK
jgi:hypothetical protein